MSHQNYLGFQLPGYLLNACHAFVIAKSRGLGISVGGLFCVAVKYILGGKVFFYSIF